MESVTHCSKKEENFDEKLKTIKKMRKGCRQWECIQGGCYLFISEEHFAVYQVFI
jgi:hypothetical protein